jgi:hypothetical protein
MSTEGLIERLDRLESRQAITQVLTDYIRANDRVDEALLRSCFWPEARHRHGRFDGLSRDFAAFAFDILRNVSYASHQITNIAIEIDGERAFTECYYRAHHRRTAADGGEEDAFFEGRYLDLFERRDGAWKIIARRGLSDYILVLPAATPTASWPAGQRSQRFPDDDYYRIRDAFRRGGEAGRQPS